MDSGKNVDEVLDERLYWLKQKASELVMNNSGNLEEYLELEKLINQLEGSIF